MKKLLLILLILISGKAFSQLYQSMPQKYYFKDSIKLNKHRNNYALDSILATDASGRLIQVLKPTGGGSVIDTANKWINTIYRKPGRDSIFFNKGGIEYAIKDSIGAGGSGSGIVSLGTTGNYGLTRINDSTYRVDSATLAALFLRRADSALSYITPNRLADSIATVTNIYKANGTLLGDRTVDGDGHYLDINNASTINLQANTDVTIGGYGDNVLYGTNWRVSSPLQVNEYAQLDSTKLRKVRVLPDADSAYMKDPITGKVGYGLVNGKIYNLEQVLTAGSTTTTNHTIDAGTNNLWVNWTNLYDANQHNYINQANIADYGGGGEAEPYTRINIGSYETGGSGNSNEISVSNHPKYGVRLNTGNGFGEHRVMYLRTDSLIFAAYNVGNFSIGLAMSGAGSGNQLISFPSIQTAASKAGKKVALIDTANKQISYISTDSLGGGGEVNTASNLGGGLANYDSKSGVDLRFNSFAAADFDLASNVINIDAGLKTDWQTAYTDRLKWDGGATGLTASTGRTSLGGTTIGQNIFTSTNPSAITFLRGNADNSVDWLSASAFRTAIGAVNLAEADLTQASSSRTYNIGYAATSGTRALYIGQPNTAERAGIRLSTDNTTHSGSTEIGSTDSITNTVIKYSQAPFDGYASHVLQSFVTGHNSRVYYYQDSIVMLVANGSYLNPQKAVKITADSFLIKGNMGVSASSTDSVLVRGSDNVIKLRAQSDIAGGGGGSGTVNSGNQYRLAYYATTGTAVSEAAAITASRALVSDANGVPTHATTTATEIGYVNGVTSAIQTQLNGKQSTITFGTGVQTALGVNIGSAGAPVLFNGAGGTPSSLVGTNITGTAVGLTAGNVITNANLTGPVTSTGNATAIANGAISNAMLANGAVANLSGTNTGDQNLFSSIPVAGQTTVTANSATTALTLVAGTNMTITTNNTTKEITLAATGGGSGLTFAQVSALMVIKY